MKDVTFSVAVRNMNLGRLEEQFQVAQDMGFAELHFELHDGHFAPRLGLGLDLLAVARDACGLTRHLNLVVDNPETILPLCLESPADVITLPVETCVHHHRALSQIRELGKKVGLALQPSTPLTKVEYLLKLVDRVVLWAVEDSGGTDTLRPSVFERVRIIRESLHYEELQARVEVIGALTPHTAATLRHQGADIFTLDAASVRPGCSDTVLSLPSFRDEMAAAEDLV